MCSEVPAAPESLPSSAAFCRGQGIPTGGPKRPFAARERRRGGDSGPGPAKRVFAKTMHLRQRNPGRVAAPPRLRPGYSAGVCAVFAIANSNGRVPQDALEKPLKCPSSFPGGPRGIRACKMKKEKNSRSTLKLVLRTSPSDSLLRGVEKRTVEFLGPVLDPVRDRG